MQAGYLVLLKVDSIRRSPWPRFVIGRMVNVLQLLKSKQHNHHTNGKDVPSVSF